MFPSSSSQYCARPWCSFVSGRVLSKQELRDLDEDSDDDDQEEAFELGMHTVKSRKNKKSDVKLRTPTHTLDLRTRAFAWPYPWLRVQIGINGPGREADSILKGKFHVLQYALTDASGPEAGVADISLFLTSVETAAMTSHAGGDRPTTGQRTLWQAQVKDFADYLRERSRQEPDHVKLSNLLPLLRDYELAEPSSRTPETNPGQFAHDLRRGISASEPGCVLALAIEAKNFFKIAPLLFPRKVSSLIKNPDDSPEDERSKEELHKVLDKLTLEEPWKFGYSELLYKATRSPHRLWGGLEASLSAMKRSPFYPGLTPNLKDALHIYDVIKYTCHKDGHTYVLDEDVKKQFNFLTKKSYDEYVMYKTFYDALNFLVDQEVLVRDVGDMKERFHLTRYWRAEEKIRDSLESLMDNEEWKLEVDVDNDPLFARIKTDPMQLLASGKILSNPVTMISGRGGTGKTEVVTSVLAAAEKQIKQEEEEEKQKMRDRIKAAAAAAAAAAADSDPESSNYETANESGDDLFFQPPNDQKDQTDQDDQDDPSAKSKSNGPILYTAPTGKAASVIRKRINKKAFTIHQILASYKMWAKAQSNSQGGGGPASPWKFAETKILAVDESSMVSIELFSHALSTLQRGCPDLRKIVLLGDVHQLPSIEPGNFMFDLFNALKQKNFVVELTTNHRSEGSIIFDNAKLISERKPPVFDNEKGFHLLVPSSQNMAMLPASARYGAQKLTPVNKLTQRIEFEKKVDEFSFPKEKQEIYLSLLWNMREAYGLEDQTTSQLIAFRRNECSALNEICCQVYNHHPVYEPPEDPRSSRRVKISFQTDDKIMCSKNSDVRLYVDADEEEDDDEGKAETERRTQITGGNNRPTLKTVVDRLMNGSTYIINGTGREMVEEAKPTQGDGEVGGRDETTGAEAAGSDRDGQKKRSSAEFYILGDVTGSDVIRPHKHDFLSFCRPCHAWALTIHKFQGSETDSVVYGVSSSNNETWQHVYTAVTRGKKRVVVVGRYEDLLAAVRRSPRPRQTTLQAKVHRLLRGHRQSGRTRQADEEYDVCTPRPLDESTPSAADGVLGWMPKKDVFAMPATPGLGARPGAGGVSATPANPGLGGARASAFDDEFGDGCANDSFDDFLSQLSQEALRLDKSPQKRKTNARPSDAHRVKKNSLNL